MRAASKSSARDRHAHFDHLGELLHHFGFEVLYAFRSSALVARLALLEFRIPGGLP